MICLHEEFEATVEVNRLTHAGNSRVTGYAADVRIECVACRLPFLFLGLRPGVDPRIPTVSIDGTELRAPIAPAPEGPEH